MRQHPQQQAQTLFPPTVQRRSRSRPAVQWQVATDDIAASPTIRQMHHTRPEPTTATQATTPSQKSAPTLEPVPPRLREIEVTDDAQPQPREGIRAALRRSRTRLIVGVLAGITVMFILYQLGAQVVVPFGSFVVDHWHYGTDRLIQYDQNVGHGGVSHFLAEDLRGEILVIEFSPDHPEQVHVYPVAQVTNDHRPHTVTLHFEDVNRDGTLDILVQVDQQPIPYTLFNTGRVFQMSDPTYQQAPTGGSHR